MIFKKLIKYKILEYCIEYIANTLYKNIFILPNLTNIKNFPNMNRKDVGNYLSRYNFSEEQIDSIYMDYLKSWNNFGIPITTGILKANLIY